MSLAPLSRREFLAASATAAAASLFPSSIFAAASKAAAPAASPAAWPIGCFNRPWTKWSYDETLDATRAAGFTLTGLLSAVPAKGDHFIGSAATPEYLASLKQKLAARGLRANMGALRLKTNLPVAEAIADTRQQLVNAQTLGLEFALTFGESNAQRYETFYKVMSDAAAFGQERGIKLVMKPHGGSSGAAGEILGAIKRVGHPNFKIWYDAGNIIYYTGKDPVTELEPIAQHVTGFCAKDCGAVKGEVMIQFGTGKVDFAAVFKKLKSAGFNGPVMIEGCAVADTLQATTENARANRLFLEKVLASV